MSVFASFSNITTTHKYYANNIFCWWNFNHVIPLPVLDRVLLIHRSGFSMIVPTDTFELQSTYLNCAPILTVFDRYSVQTNRFRNKLLLSSTQLRFSFHLGNEMHLKWWCFIKTYFWTWLLNSLYINIPRMWKCSRSFQDN